MNQIGFLVYYMFMLIFHNSTPPSSAPDSGMICCRTVTKVQSELMLWVKPTCTKEANPISALLAKNNLFSVEIFFFN